MASNKRKQDEKHLKMLREMVALPSNKTCFDCHQRGPTYVNMTIGSFVCTSCSGILRGLNPPHRVKSISMASFTPEEMDFLKAHGNDLNRKVYLGLYDNRTWPEPDSRDEQRVRDFMVQKYENKRFYVAPTEAMRDEARRMNESALSKQPQTKPLRALLGENATKLVVGNSQTSQTSQSSSQVSSSMAAPARSTAPPPITAHQQPAAKPAAGGFDLLGDLGSDPFASSVPAPASSNTGGFADFSSFGSAPVAAPAQPAQPTAPVAFPPLSSAPLQPFNSGGGAGLQPMPTNPSSAPPTSTPTQNHTQASSTNFSAISDKYAALADLDSTFNAPSTQATTVNWGGSDSLAGTGIGTGVGTGGSLNWGGSAGSTGAGDGGSVNWGGQSGAGGGAGSGSVGWNSSGGGLGGPTPAAGGVFGGTTSTDPWLYSTTLGKPGNPFLAHTAAANPFGVSSTPAMSHGGGVMPGQANPFGTTSAAGTFGNPAPASTAGAGFGFPQQQFPVQNGGFGMATTAASGFSAFGGPPPVTAPPPYGVAQQQGFQTSMAPQGFPMQQGQGFPAAQPGFGAGWGQAPTQQPASSANPFMSAVNQQQVPPRGTSTNPFL